MRLLKWSSPNELSLTDDLVDDVPPYAILSHTWGLDNDEVTFTDLQQRQGRSKAGYAKIQFCGERARKDGIEYFWMDTCCINKENHVELSEAITSMFRWYQEAEKCYVYLSDVSDCKHGNDSDTQHAWKLSFRTSRWFTRGWTLQELLAPKVVEFFSREGELLGTKERLSQQIHEMTKIPIAALNGTPLPHFSTDERMQWAEKRKTKKKEDKAYCLLGIFQVFMPLIYGEGDNAFRRLQKEINDQSSRDVTTRLGEGHTVHQQGSVEARSLGWCMGLAPLIDPDSFIGRAAEIDAMNEILRPDEASIDPRRAVLGGMGGIGKTQIAIAYARRHQRRYTSVIWLNATSELTLHASLRSVAQGLVPAADLARLDNQQALARIHEWLSHPRNPRWLLILDNYDDPAQFDVDSFCPNIGQGSVIVTTRLPDLVRGRRVPVQPLQTIDDSLDILQARSGRENVKNDAGARRLAERLGGLPLAVATAGAYLCKSAITFQQYLDIYKQRWKIDPRRPMQLQEYQGRTLYTTWNLSYSRLVNDDPDAAQMLRLLAYFDNQEVWYELFQAGLSNQSPAWLQASFTEQTGFESVMRTLVDSGLVEAQYTSQSYSIHSCVHDWMLGKLNERIDPQLYWYAFDCVAGSIDKDDTDSLVHVRYARISRHGVRLTHQRFEQPSELDHSLSKRLDQAVLIGRMLTYQVQFLAAEQMYLRALAAHETALGPNHTSTLATVNAVGVLYWKQDKLDAAEQMYLRALVRTEKVLGPDHTLTLHTVNNLGLLYVDQDKLDTAEQTYVRALAGYKEALGLDHTLTLSTVNNLGILYHTQGKLDEAEQMYVRALAGYEKALRHDYTSILDVVHNLGTLYHTQGKLNEAEQMYVRALAGYKKALGPDHTSTLKTVHDLSILYRDQGKLIEIIKLVSIWESRDVNLFGALGRVLLQIQDDSNAQIAFRHQIKYQDNILLFAGIKCDGCGLPVTCAKTRFVCRQCADGDLCGECWKAIQSDTRQVATCMNHTFLKISSETFSDMEQGRDRASWFQDLAVKYSDQIAIDSSGQDGAM